MFPETRKMIESWSKNRRRPEEIFPPWLLTCNRACCRNGRANLGLKRIVPQKENENEKKE